MATNPEFPTIAWAGPASSGRSRAGLGPHRYIVWHCTSNATSDAWGEAAFARNRTDGVGTHAVADANVCLQTQVTSLYVGHVGSSTGNRYVIAIEQCGVESDSAAHWRPIIDRVVPFARLCMAKYGIANRWLTIDQMRDGRSTGHVTHDMARIAWGSTDHTDPGPNFPKDYVTAAVAGLAGASAAEGALMALSDQQQQDLWEWLALLVDPGTPPAGRPGDRFHFPPTLFQLKTKVDALAAGGVDPAAVAALVVEQLGPLLPTLADIEQVVDAKVKAAINGTHLQV